MQMPSPPTKPASLVRKGVIPAALLAALASPMAYNTLEKLEGNVLAVYADKLADGVPTFCAGRTDWNAVPGTKLTSDDCVTVNKITILEYGYAVLSCVDWNYLTPNRLISLTMFAVNVGQSAACGSSAVRAINVGQVAYGCNLLAYTPSGKPNWSYAGGVFVQGLHNRRRAERDICLNLGAK